MKVISNSKYRVRVYGSGYVVEKFISNQWLYVGFSPSLATATEKMESLSGR